ncbi:DNA primase [bacterium]|nr:DNA primase [bacterium]
MRYPPEFVDRVQEANNLVDIISQYTQLKQSGNGYMGRCPFPDHAEKTASFSVSEAKQVYHCFGCKKSGNIFRFLSDYNGMSFPEGIEYLAERASIPLPEPVREQGSDQYHEQQDKKKSMLRANKMAMEFFRETLKRTSNDHPIRAYIQKRKLKPETLEEFQIGFAPEEWEGLANHLHRNKVPATLAEEARLVKARKEGNGHFDLFRDRLMFPILSPTQEVLAFGGRIHDQGEPKYLNSPETPVFNKSKVLYGLAHTAKYIRSEDAVIIVEGYMDLVSLFQAGLRNVAASMGTALTAEHAKLIKRLTTNVIVLFDSDEAGQRAAERSLPLLLAAGLYPKGLSFTDAKDPDEYVTKFGMEALKQKIDSSPELFNMVLQMWMSDYKGEASQKVKLMDLVRPVFDAIPDNRLKSLYAQELSHRMNVGLDWVRSSLTSNNSNRDYQRRSPNEGTAVPAATGADTQKTAPPEPKKPLFLISGASQAESLLLQLSLKSRANFEVVLGQQILSQIAHLGVKSLMEKAEQVYRQDANKFDKLTSLLIEYVDRPELLFSNSLIGAEDFDAEKENKMIMDCCKRIQQTFLKDQAKRIALGINKNDTEKLKEIDDLQRNRISLNKTDKN